MELTFCEFLLAPTLQRMQRRLFCTSRCVLPKHFSFNNGLAIRTSWRVYG